MVHHLQLSVVVASCRPRQLALCLAQLRAQRDPPGYELVVVAEGEDPELEQLARHYRAEQFLRKPLEGNCGAAAKDRGVALARAPHVVFWDDDNYYEPGALQLLGRACRGVDLGVVQCLHWQYGRFQRIPGQFAGEPQLGTIDTMCLAVRRQLARQESWHAHRGTGTDYHWLCKLLTHAPSYRFLPELVGNHLPWRIGPL